jgi:uncharacterized protein (TIGR04255 family)
MSNKLPKKLTNCPLVETVLEMRFISQFPDDAVFGVVYNSLLPEFGHFISKGQPILQVPAEIREKDPSMRFQPYYQMTSDNLSIGIGPRSIIFSNRAPYKGWVGFKEFVQSALDLIFTTDAVQTVQRLSIRYINIFDMPLFKATKVNIFLGKPDFNPAAVTTLHTEIPQTDGSLLVFQLNNNVMVSVNGLSPKKSSMIDIDSIQVVNKTKLETKNEIDCIISKLHENEKDAFFNLLSDDFLTSLSPVY